MTFQRFSTRSSINKPPAKSRHSTRWLKPAFESLEDRITPRAAGVDAALNVVLVSDAVAQAQEIRRAAATGTIAIVYRAEIMTTTGWVDLIHSVSAAHNGAPIRQLGIVAHGGPGEVNLGKGNDLSCAGSRSRRSGGVFQSTDEC